MPFIIVIMHASLPIYLKTLNQYVMNFKIYFYTLKTTLLDGFMIYIFETIKGL